MSLKMFLHLFLWSWWFVQVISQVTYDFEDAVLPREIQALPNPLSSNITNTRSKHGFKSLQWIWKSGDILQWDLTTYAIQGHNLLKLGGIKFSIYNTDRKEGNCFTFCTEQKETKRPDAAVTCKNANSKATSCFRLSLDFTGWRTVWVRYNEYKGCPFQSNVKSPFIFMSCFKKSLSRISKFFILAPSSFSSTSGIIFLDFLQFVPKLSRKSTRDLVVPPIKSSSGKCFGCSEFKNITETDALVHSDQKYTWLQAFRWSIREPTPVPNGTVDKEKISQLDLIKKRLINWYAGENVAYFSFKGSAAAASLSQKRWKYFSRKSKSPKIPCHKQLGSIECSRELFKSLNLKQQIICVPPLFCNLCKFSKTAAGEMRFTDVFYKILLPLSLEHFIWSRSVEVCQIAKRYRCTKVPDAAQLDEITNNDNELKNVFLRAYGGGPSSTLTNSKSLVCPYQQSACVEHLKNTIKAVNEKRRYRITLLFDYIMDQGFAKGSGLGTLGHQMLTGHGFMHAAFLMRKELEETGRLQDIIDTMKWYSDFGEVYQDEFEYKGTSADRMRTIMIFRLLTVLSMPQNTDSEKKRKLRDALALKRWIDNALSINEGLSGVIKPDFTGFHHEMIYAGAYIPSALHKASLISYLLDGTKDFMLSSSSRSNLKNALDVLETLAAKYSITPSVTGRYPRYNTARLGKHLSAYAYISVKAPNITLDGRLGSIALKNENIRVFLRLYDFQASTCPSKLNLCSGKIGSIFFLNSLGAAELLENVKLKASKFRGNFPSMPPNGNWAKNYAALSVHRRAYWSVTVKGFNKFVFAYEGYRHSHENEYGMYGSYGSVLIANNEESLDTKDVERGWDWRKVPGTTAIAMSYEEMKQVVGWRYSNPRVLAGGVTFQSSRTPSQSNGAFGMDFFQPEYNIPVNNPLQGAEFQFKKSVSFFNDVIVLLGSNISSLSSQPAHSTLFQDLVKPVNANAKNTPSSSSTLLRCNDPGTLIKRNWLPEKPVILVDVNGNRYYIRRPHTLRLVFQRRVKQTSVRSAGKFGKSDGIYCTAWFNHGAKPQTVGKNWYSYIVQVDAEREISQHRFQSKSLIAPSDYVELERSSNAHVVKFIDRSSNLSRTVHSYVNFKAGYIYTSGPLKSVNAQCLLMTEENSNHLAYISASYPQLNLTKQLPSTKNPNPSYCTDSWSAKMPTIAGRIKTGLLYCVKNQPTDIMINLRKKKEYVIEGIFVDGKSVSTKDLPYYAVVKYLPEGTAVHFRNMKFGFTTEVKLSSSTKASAKYIAKAT